MAVRGDGLAMQHGVGERVGAERDLHGGHREAFDLVHVQALVDEADEEPVRRLGLGAHLTALPVLDALGLDIQGQDAARGLGKRGGAIRAPGADPDIGLDLEVLVGDRGVHEASDATAPCAARSP